MAKKKIILPIGDKKALSYEADPEYKEDLEFAERCKAVAASGPASIQEFFTRLNEVTKQQPQKPAPKKGRKI